MSGTHLLGVRDDGLTVLDDELEVVMRLCENEAVRADTTADVDDDGALREVLPRETCVGVRVSTQCTRARRLCCDDVPSRIAPGDAMACVPCMPRVKRWRR